MKLRGGGGGGGFLFTLRAVPAFATVWLLVLAAVSVPLLVATVIFARAIADELGMWVWLLVFVGVITLVLCVAGIAFFTTARLAGPFVALQRAFEDVGNGDSHRRLSFRKDERHLRELERGFNDMMASLRRRMAVGDESSPNSRAAMKNSDASEDTAKT